MIYLVPLAMLVLAALSWLLGYRLGKAHADQDAKIEARGATLDAHFTFHPQRCTLCGEPCNYNKRRGWHCLGCDVSYTPKD